jgi:hypothetical protein
MSKDKCTNNTGLSFSSSNGTSMGWDTNGTPCQITDKSKGTSSTSNFSKGNTSTIVDQYIIDPNAQNFGSGNSSQNSGSMGFSQLMSGGNSGTNTNMPNVISSAYNEGLQGKSFALNKRKELGETYALPYDDKGNLLSGTQLRDKYDALFKTDQPLDSEASHKKMLNYIKEIEEEKKQQKLEKDTTFKKPVSSDKQDLQIKSSTYQNQFEDKAKKEFEALEREIREEMLNPAVVNAEQEKRYSEISETLASLGISDINPSQKKIEKPVITNVKNDDKPKQSDQEKLTQDLSDKYGKVFVGTTSSFVKKAGDSENADLKAIHFTYGLEGITSISGGCGYGTMVYLPINDDYIEKAIPALSMFNLNYLSIQNSKVGNKGITLLMNANLCIKEWNLSNNNIDDEGAEIISHALITGSLSNLKVMHVEGNKFSSAGEGYLVKALLNQAVHDMIIITQSYKGQFDEHVKMIFGTKEEKAVIYKDLIKQGSEKGTNDQCIVVDKTLWGDVKNIGYHAAVIGTAVSGFIKCKWHPEEIIQSYVEGKLIAKLPKNLGKLIGELVDVESSVSCYFKASNDAWTSEFGQNVLTHELWVTGENGFCNDQ